jgi:2-dehydro-3-deoxyglucarate aldolase/4-hydroxy-2-oxoheptanedioate aldolase
MPLRENTLKRRIKEGGVALGTNLHAARDPEQVYHVAAAGVDFVFIDLEHGPLNLETAVELVWHCHAAGINPMIRIPDLQYAYVTRLLDNGAQTLLVPHVKEPAEIKRLIDLAKYAPLGHRGFAMGMNAGTNFETVSDPVAGAQWQNDNVFLGINIETAEAVDNLGDMLAPGIDFVIVGYADLSQAFGILGQFEHERIQEVRAQTNKLCVERGIARMVTPTAGQFRAAVENGDQLLLFGSTMGFVRAGLGAAANEFREATK